MRPVSYKVSDIIAVVPFDITAGVPGCLYANFVDYDRSMIKRTRKVVIVRSVYYTSDVVRSNVLLLVAGDLHPLVFSRKSSEYWVLVLLTVHRLPLFHEIVTAFVQGTKEIVRNTGQVLPSC